MKESVSLQMTPYFFGGVGGFCVRPGTARLEARMLPSLRSKHTLYLPLSNLLYGLGNLIYPSVFLLNFAKV